MRQRLLPSLLAVSALLAVQCQTTTPIDQHSGKPTLFPVAEVVGVISKAIQDTQATIKKTPALPPLESVTLTLQTVTTTTQSGGAKFVVVGGTRGLEQSQTETVTIKLTPPDPEAATSVSGTEAVYEKLKASILRVADAARDAETGATGVLDVSGIGTELAFAVKTSNEGTLGFKIEPVELSGKLSSADQAVHKIGVSFARKKK